MNDNIPQLSIERMDDGIGDGLILLEQDDGSGNVHSISIHPVHLRLMAEKMGLVKTDDPQAQRMIATLTRQLHLLRERCGHLAYWLSDLSDSEHADLSYEKVYSAATATMADEFCADLDQSAEATDQPLTKPSPKPSDVAGGAALSRVTHTGHHPREPGCSPMQPDLLTGDGT